MCLYHEGKPASHDDAGCYQPGGETLPVRVSSVHLRLEIQQTVIISLEMEFKTPSFTPVAIPPLGAHNLLRRDR